MKNLAAENEKLKAELAQSVEIIATQKEIIHQLRDEFHLILHDAIESIECDYSTILNPLPVELKTAYKGKHEEFLIKSTDVLCITCKGKIKTIHLLKSMENVKGVYRETDSIVVDNNLGLEDFRHTIDSISYHLIQVSRNTVVNMKYYSMQKDFVQINLEEFSKAEFASIEISDSHKENFIKRKQMLNEIVSLQNKLLRYIG